MLSNSHLTTRNNFPLADKKLNEYFQKFIQSLLATNPDTRILLLYSGGLDSTLLIELLLRFFTPHTKIGKKALTLLHVNYHLRKESLEDEEWVKSYAKDKGLEVIVKSEPLNSLSETNNNIPNLQGGNIQGLARKIRYQHAKEILNTRNIDYLLTGHHFDDALENFYLKQIKGQSTKSIKQLFSTSASPSLVKNHLKPLLPFTKESLKTALLDFYPNEDLTQKQLYRNDKSNQKNTYERNYLRNIIFPQLDIKFSSWKKNVFRFHQSVNTQTDLLEYLIKKDRLVITDPPFFQLSNDFFTYPAAIQQWLLHFYLNQIFPEERFSEASINNYLDKMIQKTATRDQLHEAFGGVLLRTKQWGSVYYSHGLIGPATALSNIPPHTLLKNISQSIKFFKANRQQPFKIATITPPDLKSKLTQPPLASKSLKDILSQHKIPLVARKSGLIIKSNSGEIMAFLNPLVAFRSLTPDKKTSDFFIVVNSYELILK